MISTTVLDCITTFVIAASLGLCAFNFYMTRKNLRRGQWFSAQDYARLAVFESWVRSGGRRTPFSEELEFSMRQTFAAVAAKKSKAFYEDFVRFETIADQELDAVIAKIGGTLTHDQTVIDISDQYRAGRQQSGDAESDRHGLDFQKP